MLPVILETTNKGVFVAGDNPGVCRFVDNTIDFLPSGIPSCLYATTFGDFIVILREKSYTIGSLEDDSIIEIRHTDIPGKASSMALMETSIYIIPSIINKSYLFVVDTSTFTVTLKFHLQLGVSVNSIVCFSVSDHSCASIQCGAKGSGESIIIENTTEGIKKLSSLNFPFDATAGAYSNNKLYVAAGSSLYTFNAEVNESGELILTKASEAKGRMLAVDTIVEKSQMLYVNIFKSACIYETGFVEPQIMHTDFLSKPLTAGCFCNDGIIVGDVTGAIYHLLCKSQVVAMTPSTRFSLNEPITSITRWKPQKLSEGITESFAVTTTNGGLYCLVLTKNETIKAFDAIEGESECIKSAAITPYYCTEQASNYADADIDIEDDSSVPQEAASLIEWMQSN